MQFPHRTFDYTFGWVYLTEPAYLFLDTPIFYEYNLGKAFHDYSGWWGGWETYHNNASKTLPFTLCMEGSLDNEI